MAKYRHRLFEMFDFRKEAVAELTRRPENPASEAMTPEDWGFALLSVSRSDGAMLVEFKQADSFSDEDISDFRQDLDQLAQRLSRDSKLLFDFTGVQSFGPASIDALALLHQKLQTKGSRMALCRLAPEVRESFFPVRST